MFKKSLLAATVSVIGCLNAQADSFSERVDSTFQYIIDDDEPGCSVGVIESGEWIFQAAYGLASLELQVPMTTQNVHNLASVSKQFTAMAVHLLADEGKIDLNEDIRTYLPALMDYGEPVTINAMLGHVSGMANYSDYEYWVSQPGGESLMLTTAVGDPLSLDSKYYLSISDLYAYLQDVPLRYSPNEQFHYSNITYFLFSMLVEEVTGQNLAEYAHQKIFQPLGMSDTVFLDSPYPVIENRVTGYDKVRGRYVRLEIDQHEVGDSNLYTSIEDMLTWDRHFYDPQLGSDPESLIEDFNQPNSSIRDNESLYANGQFVTDRYEQPVYSHDGWHAGSKTYYERYPESEFSIVILCNDASRDPTAFARFISQYYFDPEL
ncbi:MAG: serine hydrolase domain-containing protein [Saccharospirillum sp.]|uniref:serine hydrolase domain-containing protein n=1 Tax=Saccharospirillum sp. TaxID=2033801 RepID=UPI003296C18E